MVGRVKYLSGFRSASNGTTRLSKTRVREFSQTRLKLITDRFHMEIKSEECLSCHRVITDREDFRL